MHRYCIFYSLHGIGFACYIHWFTAIYLFALMIPFYSISLLKGSKLNPVSTKIGRKSHSFMNLQALTWLLCSLVLISCDYYRGYRVFEWFLGPEHWIAVMIDEFRGSLPWHIYFRMTMLRVISFNMDKYWSANNSEVYKVYSSNASNNLFFDRLRTHTQNELLSIFHKDTTAHFNLYLMYYIRYCTLQAQ